MTDTASTQLLPTYIPSLPERLNNLEALLADRTHRQAIEQRAVILERNDIVRNLLLRGETLAHIGRVLNIQRERVRQIKDSLPPEVRERHAQVRISIKKQKQQFRADRLREWKKLKKELECTTIDGKLRPEYQVFRGMLARCLNINNPNYSRYGGRGVKVCDRWDPRKVGTKRAFTNFVRDMGPRPGGKTRNGRALYSIHRMDNYPEYGPGYCVWATHKEQCANGQRRPRKARVQ